MRRGPAWAMALVLGLGGVAACGGGDGEDTKNVSTTTAAPTTAGTEGDDLTAAVDDFCAASDEYQSIIQAQIAAESGGGPVDPSTSEAASARMSELTGPITTGLMSLQGVVDQMLPGDAARFQRCAAAFGGGVEGAPPG